MLSTFFGFDIFQLLIGFVGKEFTRMTLKIPSVIDVDPMSRVTRFGRDSNIPSVLIWASNVLPRSLRILICKTMN